jgi:hypothetical protein
LIKSQERKARDLSANNIILDTSAKKSQRKNFETCLDSRKFIKTIGANTNIPDLDLPIEENETLSGKKKSLVEPCKQQNHTDRVLSSKNKRMASRIDRSSISEFDGGIGHAYSSSSNLKKIFTMKFQNFRGKSSDLNEKDHE